jgi:hypothetical protein
VRISQSDARGFKAQSLLQKGLERALTWHSRTSMHAVYEPKLTANSTEELIEQTLLYFSFLFPQKNSPYSSDRRGRRA